MTVNNNNNEKNQKKKKKMRICSTNCQQFSKKENNSQNLT